MISVEIGNAEYPLVKKTIKIAKLIDAAHKSARTTVESYKKQYECVCACIGTDAAAKVLDGTTIDEIDLTELSIVFLKIEKAYITPVEEANAEINEQDKILSQVAQLGESIDKITKVKELKEF